MTYGAPQGYKPETPAEESLSVARRREAEHVVARMVEAGWPGARFEMTSTADGGTFEAVSLEPSYVYLADIYLCSSVLRVKTLIELGPLAETDLGAALELATPVTEAA